MVVNFFNRFAIFTILLQGCVGKTKKDCEAGEKEYKKDIIGVVLTKKPSRNWYYFLEGRSLETGKDTIYKFEGRWYGQLESYWTVGDTIIKKKGELFLEIRKKDTVHISEWRCDDILIDGISVSELAKRKKYGK